jgi:hypothetical protein
VIGAYATPENARLGGSRFVRRVEIRGERGQVWLTGRRRTRNLILQVDARDEDSLLAALSGTAPVGSAAPLAFS